MLELDVNLSLDRFDLAAAFQIDAPLTAIFGPEGSGKSTLLRMMAGTVNPQRGWIRFGGETLVDTRRGIRVPAGRRRIGLVDQAQTLDTHEAVLDHLRDAQLHASVPVAAEGFDEVVHLLELEPLLDTRIHELSTAEIGRISLARSLIASPRLLLLDEPKGSPHRQAASAIHPYLTRVRESLNLPIIYVSQSLGDILRITEEVVLMANGRVLGVGNVHEIVADRILLAATALQGIENILPVTILAHETESGCTLAYYYGSELVLPIAPGLAKGSTTQIAIRSSDIALSKQYLNGTSIQNQIKGRICAIIRTPDHAVVQVDCGNTLLVGVSLRALKQMELREGDSVYCLVKAHAFSYLGQAVMPVSRHSRISH